MDSKEIYFVPPLETCKTKSCCSPTLSQRVRNYFGYTQKQLKTIAIFGLANLFLWTTNALQAPFYPKEAESKGASSTEYGLVLGVGQLVMFIMSPVFGYMVGFVDPRIVFNVGVVGTAACAISFGFLHFIEDHVTFIALSFIIRILQGCGNAASATASFTIIAIEFPKSVASAFATIETCCGIGLIVGPSLGGVLFQVGGFVLPFLFTGSCFLLVGLLSQFLLPPTVLEELGRKQSLHELSIAIGKKTGMISMLRIPTVFLGFFSLFASASSIGFLVSTLEPHLREHFNLSPAMTGLTFLIDGGFYALTAPFWGKLCDQSGQIHVYTIMGSLMTFTGFLIIGPAPFIPLPTILWVTCLGLGIHGVGTGASFVSSFVVAMEGSVENGFRESLSTYGLVSGLYMSTLSLGSFVGPSIGGVLLDYFGFKLSCYYVFIIHLVVMTSAWIYISMRRTGGANFSSGRKNVF